MHTEYMSDDEIKILFTQLYVIYSTEWKLLHKMSSLAKHWQICNVEKTDWKKATDFCYTKKDSQEAKKPIQSWVLFNLQTKVLLIVLQLGEKMPEKKIFNKNWYLL